MKNIEKLLLDTKIPKMIKIKQKFDEDKIDDIAGTVLEQISRDEIAGKIEAGKRYAITCGSRGVSNIALIIKTVAKFIKEKGGQPFVVPAMGSHGGATAEGQLGICHALNVTEEYVECPILSSMDVVLVGKTHMDESVYIDKNAYEADGIIAINRIKTHTSFRGEFESGVTKMLTIGLGKQVGAESCHSSGVKYMPDKIPRFAAVIRENANIVAGIGTIENAFDETCKIAAMTSDEIPLIEPKLLLESKGKMGRILFDKFDVLIVDEIGKEISGAGMDTNITGRFDTPYASGGPDVQRIAVLDLSEKTHGNGMGIGLADFTTRRVFDKFDFDETYPNIITNLIPHTVYLPVIMETDELAIKAAIKTCMNINHDNPEIVYIKNTHSIREIYISEALLESARNNSSIEIISDAEFLDFSNRENLF